MPMQYVDPEVAYVLAPDTVVNHVYKDDDFDCPLEYWFEFDGVQFDCRDWPVEESYAARVGPFKGVPPDKVRDITVRMLVDAVAVYVKTINHHNTDDAILIASASDDGWVFSHFFENAQDDMDYDAD